MPLRPTASSLIAMLLAGSALADEAPVQTVQVLGHYDTAVGSSNAASEGTVTAKLLANRPALRPAELLEFVPGMIVTQHSGDGKANQYFLRGFNLDHGTDFATFVDGMPVNQPTHAHGHGYTDLNFLIPELVRRIDYRKGPYFASDGDFASAGSARLSLVDELPRGLAQLTLGEHGYRRALLAQSTGHWLGALELQGNDGPWRDPERLHKLNGWLRWSDNSERVQRSVTLMAYNARWNATDQIPARAALDRFASLDPSDGGRTQRISLSAQQRVTLDDGDWRVSAYAIGSRLNLWSNFTYFLDDPVNGDQFEQAERRHTLGGEASRRWSFELVGREAQLTVGAQARDDRLSPIGLYRTAQRERVATTQEQKVRQREFGVYGELATTWTPWLRSIAGLRTDRWQAQVNGLGSRSASLTSPKLSLVFGPWQQTEAFVNWGTGFHSNDARGALAATDPAPPLVKSRGAELGLRSELVPGLQSSLALWRLDLDSELVFLGDAGSTDAQRASRRHGVEWGNHWRLDALGWKGWLLDADLAWSQARFRPSQPEGDHVPGAVNRVASLGLTYAGPGRLFGAFELRHFGPRDLVEDGSQRSRATTLASLRGGWRVNRDVTLTADVFNLFDRRASDIDYVYTSRLPGEPADGVMDRHFHPVEPRSLRVTLAINW